MGYYLDWMYPLFDTLNKKKILKSPMAQLGSQQIFGHGADCSVKQIFKDRYGITEYTDFDLNGKAMINLDLTQPLPSEYRLKYGTVVDSGTIEHIFDQYSAFKNSHAMCAVGGTIIHIQMMRGIWNHGFYSYHPRFFHEIARYNAYEIKHTAFYYRMNEEEGNTYTEDFGDDAYMRGRKCPFDIYPLELTFVIAMEKTSSKAFQLPLDVDA